jgi:hypothetical protein
MHLLGRNRLLPLRGRSVELDQWVCAWSAEMACGQWLQMNEVLKDFPNAREKSGSVAFPILRERQLIIVTMRFSQRIALISGVEAE